MFVDWLACSLQPQQHPGLVDGDIVGAVNVAILLGVVLDDLHQVGIPESGVRNAVGIETHEELARCARDCTVGGVGVASS